MLWLVLFSAASLHAVVIRRLGTSYAARARGVRGPLGGHTLAYTRPTTDQVNSLLTTVDIYKGVCC